MTGNSSLERSQQLGVRGGRVDKRASGALPRRPSAPSANGLKEPTVEEIEVRGRRARCV